MAEALLCVCGFGSLVSSAIVTLRRTRTLRLSYARYACRIVLMQTFPCSCAPDRDCAHRFVLTRTCTLLCVTRTLLRAALRLQVFCDSRAIVDFRLAPFVRRACAEIWTLHKVTSPRERPAASAQHGPRSAQRRAALRVGQREIVGVFLSADLQAKFVAEKTRRVCTVLPPCLCPLGDCVPHSTGCALRGTRCILHVVCCMLHVACYMRMLYVAWLYAACCALHGARCTLRCDRR